MPCSPSQVNIPIPTGPSGPPIPGFGQPFSPINEPNISPFPAGFPEDLLTLYNSLQFLVPPGAIKSNLHANYSKDVFDGIMDMLEQFMPFLMLYKFFLPILNIIICIIEVLCSLLNPFKLPGAINRLFTVCIPEFLNMFPIFAIPIMIISMLLLLLALIEYLIVQILKLVDALLLNITALTKAFQNGSATSVLAIANKIGSLICLFQNQMVLLSIFALIIQVFKDIISKLFAIPPCDDSNNGNPDKCCSTDVCPAIIKDSPYTRTTGTLQYVRQLAYDTSSIFAGFPASFLTGFATANAVRPESWQLFDIQQTQVQEFINITHAFDVPSDTNPFPVFFPTDANYSATTPPSQSAYTLNLRFYYDPSLWGRTVAEGGSPRYVQINNCLMLYAPSTNLAEYDNTTGTINTGVVYLVGGQGYEDDGTTILTGFAADGVTPISDQATLENFLHQAAVSNLSPSGSVPYNLYPAITLSDLQYTFTPNIPVLLNKNLITLGCDPDVALNRTFVNTVLAGNVALNTTLLSNLINGVPPNVFPDPGATQECISTALTALQTNVTAAGVAQFQATATTCLNNLQNDTNSALSSVIGIAVNPCNSSFTLTPSTQFTTMPITVSVILAENNGNNVATGLPASVASSLASQITAYPSFGTIGSFTYDGYTTFVAELTSDAPGSGQISIAFDNNILCTNDLSANPPTHTLQALDYSFVYTPFPATGEPRRDTTDIANDGVV